MAQTKIPLNPGSGPLAVAVDRIAGDDFELVKITLGAIGTDDGPVSATNPLPIKIDQTTPGTTNAVADLAPANQATGQVTATTSAATMVIARATRKSVLIRNTDAAISVYIGPATVSAVNGMLLKAGESVPVDTTALIQVIAASGTPVVSYYDAWY